LVQLLVLSFSCPEWRARCQFPEMDKPCVRGFVVESVKSKAELEGVKRALRFEGQVKFRGGDATVDLQAGDSVFVLSKEQREFIESAGSNELPDLAMFESYQESKFSPSFLTNHS